MLSLQLTTTLLVFDFYVISFTTRLLKLLFSLDSFLVTLLIESEQVFPCVIATSM